MEVTPDGSYRVAERGVSNRDSVAAAAVTEAVVTGLFGVRGRKEGPAVGFEDTVFGRLDGIRVRGYGLPAS
jgi:hypothetical protein